MVDKIQTFEDLISNIPKVNIQRILLETTSANENKFTKDPHFTMPDEFQTILPTSEGDETLKVSLTLSIQGYRKRNLKNDLLRNIFDSLDMMSLVKTTIYQISKEKLGDALAIGEAVLHPDARVNLTIQQLYNLIQIGEQTGKEFNGREFNLLTDILMANDSTDLSLSRYETRTADGSIIYNFPFKIEPYTLLNKDPGFLAYMIVTEINSEALLAHIESTIGGDEGLPTTVSSYIKEFSSGIENKSITLDVVVNNSSINNTGALLKRTDNKKIWLGPYHIMPNGVIMTGAVHNDSGISEENRNIVLEPILLPNTKIVDLREDKEIEKILLKELHQLENVYKNLSAQAEIIKLPAESFSTSYMSRDAAGAHSYLFGFDKIKILLNNSLLAGVAQNLKRALSNASDSSQSDADMDSLIKDILNKSAIKYLKVFRRRVQTNKFGTNKLGTLNSTQESLMSTILDADITNSYLDDIPKEIGFYSTEKTDPSISKISGFNFLNSDLLEKQYSYFSFKDNELVSLKNGDYEYFYELVIEDGILKSLTNLIDSLINQQNVFKSYINFINNNLPLYYNEGADKFNIDNITANYEASLTEINNMIEAPLRTLRTIILLFDFNANVSDFSHGEQKLLRISNPFSGNYQGLLKTAAICDTFIEKLQKISGVYTGIETHIDLSTSVNQKAFNELRNTIKINETFPDEASLDQRGTGYEFVLTDKAKLANSMGAPTIAQIPAETFIAMANVQFSKYFRQDSENSSQLGNFNNLNKCRYFVPTQAYISNTVYNTVTHPSPFDGPAPAGFSTATAPLPSEHAFDYYKPIILDILEYYFNKSNNIYSSEIKSNIRRLINIAGKYGIAINSTIFEQLKADGLYSDTSESGKPQQQTSGPSNISGITVSSSEDPLSDYEDTDFSSEINLDIESFLFGVLSNIILGNEGQLPLDYKDLVGTVTGPGGTTAGLVGSFGLPMPLQSLFMEYNKTSTLGLLTKYLIGQTNMSFDVVKEYPLSLATFGWWWFNYSNIVEVRFISKYDTLLNPVWEPLTFDKLNNIVAGYTPQTGQDPDPGPGAKKIICKLFKYENKKFGIFNKNKFLDLPILNEYFIINPPQDVQAQPPTMEILPDAPSETKNAIEFTYAILGSEISSVLNLDQEISKNKAASSLVSMVLPIVQPVAEEDLTDVTVTPAEIDLSLPEPLGRTQTGGNTYSDSATSMSDLDSNALATVDLSTQDPAAPESDDTGPGPGINPYKF